MTLDCGLAVEMGYADPVRVCVSVTGQMVVYSEIVSVVTEPRRAGQFVIDGAQEVIVYIEVE